MKDGSVTIFELFKQTALINADKICAGSDDCRGWERERHLILLWIIKKQVSKRQHFLEINFLLSIMIFA